MSPDPQSRTLFSNAADFALMIHDKQTRPGSALPYAIHVMETAAIASTLTNDPEVLAAALLHDVMRESSASEFDLRNRFGKRVAALVMLVGTEDLHSPWQKRKLVAVTHLRGAAREEMILTLSDLLSELRAIDRVIRTEGAAAWQRFTPSNPSLQGWYFSSAAQALLPLENTDAHRELTALIRRVFGE